MFSIHSMAGFIDWVCEWVPAELVAAAESMIDFLTSQCHH